MGYSPRGHKELDTNEQLTLSVSPQDEKDGLSPHCQGIPECKLVLSCLGFIHNRVFFFFFSQQGLRSEASESS